MAEESLFFFSVPPPKDNEVKSAGTDFREESVTSGSTTASSSNGLEAQDLDEDHKPVGTSFNTKFYIIPNVTKTEVIKIVEREEDAENEVLVTAQTVGIAIYILAAFGLVPLLLALVFGAKFFLQRHRRKVRIAFFSKLVYSRSLKKKSLRQDRNE